MLAVLKHFGIRLPFVALVVGSVLSLGLLSSHARSQPVQAQAVESSRTAVILNWFAARNQGDDTAAAAMFADNIFFVSGSPVGTCSTQSPCHDPAAALQSLLASDTGAHYCVTVTSIQENGSIVTGRNEVRNDSTRSRGIERISAAFMAEVQDGKIVSLFQRVDRADAQTALSGAIAAGTAQAGTPIAMPDPVCG